MLLFSGLWLVMAGYMFYSFGMEMIDGLTLASGEEETAVSWQPAIKQE